MKAVIMAGGRGVRLQPISIGCPKPLIPVFDRPVMEHILMLLREHGIREVRATLQYMPEKIIRYFEDHPPEGMELSYSIEEQPLGTAGSVALCREFLGDEDFLVISGDAICDMDLSACIAQHIARKADATIVLYRHSKPLEYGLVMTKQDGRIERFIEKPSWSQVFCDTVNTGIYILNPRVLDRVRPGVPVDFAKDLFRDLLKEGAPIYGTAAEGYWCDIGGPEAYADCHFDLMTHKNGIQIGTMRETGCWLQSAVPDGVKLRPPVYIGADVRIGKGAEIGPYAVIGTGTQIGANALVNYSICTNAVVSEGAQIRGAVLCSGAKAGRDSVIGEGCVIGESAEVEDSVTLSPNVKVWPGLKVLRGITARHSVYSEHGGCGSLPFDERSDLRGDLSEITPEVCIRIGAALGKEGFAAVGYVGGTVAETLAAAISCGIRSAGGDALRHDARFLAEAAFAADLYGAAISAFVEAAGEEIRIRIVGKNRRQPSYETERKLNLAVRADVPAQSKARFGQERFAIGIGLAYERSFDALAEPAHVRIDSDRLPSRILKSVLKGGAAPVRITGPVIRLDTSDDGTELYVVDELGQKLDREQITALLCLVHFREGNRCVALPFDAPYTLDQLAQQEGGCIYRRGRDDEYGSNAKSSIFLRDAVMAGLKLCRYLSISGETVAGLCRQIPRFHVSVRNTPYAGDRGALMKALSMISADRELGDGLRFPLRGGWIHVAPSSSRPYIRIVGESTTMEAAEELCANVSEIIKKSDS